MLSDDSNKKCLWCGAPVIGRVDKKFCSDQCRSSYNNNLNSHDLSYIRKINTILKRNRSILCTLNPNGKTKVNVGKLRANGFDFRYFTNEYHTQHGTRYLFCYDQGYLPLDNDVYLLVQRKEI